MSRRVVIPPPLVMTRYTLFFGDLELGVVGERDADFPNLWGDFVASDKTDHPDLRARIQRFVDHCRQADRLISQGDAEGSPYDRFVQENEPQFADLIDSSDWYLVDGSGRRLAILVPNFVADGVVWRWDPRSS